MPPGIFCGLLSVGIEPLAEPELQLLDLPDELLGVIANLLGHVDLCHFAATCKRCRRVVGDDTRWQNWHSVLFGDIPLQNGFMESFSSAWREALTCWSEGQPEKHLLRGHHSYVMGLQYDEDKLVSCGGVGDQTIKIWPLAHGIPLPEITCKNTLYGHAAAVIKVRIVCAVN